MVKKGTKQKHSIDKAIREQEENEEFNEITAQLAEKVFEKMKDGVDDDDDGTYESLKDIIREHITSWYENGDTLNAVVSDPPFYGDDG